MSYLTGEQVRNRTLTEKGRIYKLGLLQERRNHVKNEVLETISIMENLFTVDDREKLKSTSDKLAGQFDELMKVHGQCQILMQSEEVVTEDAENDTNIDKLDKKVFQVRRRVQSWLSQEEAEKKTSSVPSVSKKSRKSKSSSSGSSSNDSIKLKVKEEKARLAELAIEQSFLKQTKEAELVAQQLLVEMEIAKANGKLEVYNAEEKDPLADIPEETDKERAVLDYVTLHHQREKSTKEAYDDFKVPDGWPDRINIIQKPGVAKANETTKGTSILEEKSTRFDKQEQQAVVELLRQMQAPDLEIDVFDGDPLHYLYFITNFEEVIEKSIRDERGRLTRLIQYLRGEAKELVQSCIYLPREDCYIEAKQLLKKRYGDPCRILNEFKKELKNWPKLKPNESVSHKKFLSFLLKFKSTMKFSGNSWFDSPELLQQLQAKLPLFLQDRWNRKANKIREERGSEARITDFIGLIKKEVQLVTDPLYSREATQNEEPQERSSSTKPNRFKSFVIESSEACPCCSKKHDLDDCVVYLKKPIERRRKLLYEKRLCFACYSPSNSQHFAKTCKNPRKCNHCGRSHPSSLHGLIKFKPKPETKPSDSETKNSESSTSDTVITSGCTNLQAKIVSLSVVPVILTHENSEKQIKTFALLDNGSQGSFIKDELLDEFEVDKIDTAITITTVSGETRRRCRAADGFKVASIFSTELK